jgi:hypothetical protein
MDRYTHCWFALLPASSIAGKFLFSIKQTDLWPLMFSGAVAGAFIALKGYGRRQVSVVFFLIYVLIFLIQLHEFYIFSLRYSGMELVFRVFVSGVYLCMLLVASLAFYRLPVARSEL